MKKRVLKAVFAVALCMLLSFVCFANEKEFNGYIVTLKENSAEMLAKSSLFSDRAFLFSELTDGDVVEIIDDSFDSVSSLVPNHRIITVDDQDTLNQLIEMGLVERHEEDAIVELHGNVPQGNPAFSSQWAFDYINADFAWNSGIYGEGVRVAVIDSGVYPHEDIMDNLVQGYNYYTEMDNYDKYDTTDNLGHGTFVAGIIAAQCDNSAIVGVAHKATIVPLKVCDEKSSPVSCLVQALYDAVDEEKFDCDVINMSLGTATNSTELKNAVDYALGKGVLLIASSGNDGTSNYNYPASYAGVISVANAQKDTANNTLIINPTSQHNDMVDIAAPGTDIYSIMNTATGIGKGSGTSFSSPYVAAAGVLLKSIYPDADNDMFSMLLEESADYSYITDEQDSNYWGLGLIDIEEMIKQVYKFKYSAQKGKTFYLSEIDNQTYGNNSSIYITNMTDSQLSLGNIIIVSYKNVSLPIKLVDEIMIIPANLTAYQQKEISLTQLGISGNVSVYLMNSIMMPLLPSEKTKFVTDYTTQ